MPDGCHNCRFRLRLEKLDYRRGCKHERMKGFICTAMADEGVANWMLGLDDDDSMCECWMKREEKKSYVWPRKTQGNHRRMDG